MEAFRGAVTVHRSASHLGKQTDQRHVPRLPGEYASPAHAQVSLQGSVYPTSGPKEEGELWKVLLDVLCRQRAWEGWMQLLPVGGIR